MCVSVCVCVCVYACVHGVYACVVCVCSAVCVFPRDRQTNGQTRSGNFTDNHKMSTIDLTDNTSTNGDIKIYI